MASQSGRIDGLDALRGFAILGIFLINVQVLSGYGFVGPEAHAQLTWAEFDARIGQWLDILARAKFYSLFSLLFGYSFMMIAQKAGDAAAATHLRRMAGLLVIGLAHSILLWPWDILVLYALMGLLLTPFLRFSALPLFLGGLALLFTLTVLLYFGPQIGLPEGRGAYAQQVLQESTPAFAGGTYAEVVQANLRLTLSVGVEWLQGLRPLRVFTMFLLGAAAAAIGLAERNSGRLRILALAAVIGLGGGLALELAAYGVIPANTDSHLLAVLTDGLAPPLLAVGYAAVLIFWWRGAALITRAIRSTLAPVGRMALTNYVLQSAVCVPIFYGFGGSWLAELSLAAQMLFAAGLFLFQIIFSAAWLWVFRQGPLEWLWRWQIKGRRPQLLNTSAA
ncbi:MAG: DUF418 domain-containing protein [Ectothiorhodospiraceae bacterium]|nr:DUF418 domain-containing protein [Ectothiorhodospiraceae bacterium]